MKIINKARKVGKELKFYDRIKWSSDMDSLKDGDVLVVIDTDVERKTEAQRGYYFGVIVPHFLIILRDECGYADWRDKTVKDAHNLLKLKFCPVEITDPTTGEVKIVPGTTKTMNKERKKEYIDQIVFWIEDFFSYKLPPPKRGQNIYDFA